MSLFLKDNFEARKTTHRYLGSFAVFNKTAIQNEPHNVQNFAPTYRRNNVLYFRLSIPNRFRPILNVSEFTQSLHTQDRKVAIPVAYALASDAKNLFLKLDTFMLDDNFTDDELRDYLGDLEKPNRDTGINKGYGNSLQKLMTDKKHSIAIDTLKNIHEKELEDMRI